MENTYELPRSSPAEQGVSPLAVEAFIDAVELAAAGRRDQELHSLMLVRHGHVVAEGWWRPYRAELPHMLFSLSKSFTSTAVGFAVGEGLLSVDDSVASFFTDKLPAEIGDNLEAMRVRHLLSMSTGHDRCVMDDLKAAGDDDWVRAFLLQPVPHVPGTHFVYNTAASYMLSAIVQTLVGQTLSDYLQPRLFGPLSIENPVWSKCPRGIDLGGYGLSVKTEDIAKFGQLYLQKGVWLGQRLLSDEWVSEATSSHIVDATRADDDWGQGYGYQFWRSRHGAYRGDGAFGQYCIVMPEQDAVLAITSGVASMQAVLDSVWQHLLPGLGGAPTSSPVAAEQPAGEALRARLAHLALAPTGPGGVPEIATQVSGTGYTLDENPEGLRHFSATFTADEVVAAFGTLEAGYTIRCGMGDWLESEGLPDHYGRIAVRGTWLSDSALEMVVRSIETPFCETVTCHFDATDLRLELRSYLGFGPPKVTMVRGARS